MQIISLLILLAESYSYPYAGIKWKLREPIVVHGTENFIRNKNDSNLKSLWHRPGTGVQCILEIIIELFFFCLLSVPTHSAILFEKRTLWQNLEIE